MTTALIEAVTTRGLLIPDWYARAGIAGRLLEDAEALEKAGFFRIAARVREIRGNP